MDLKAIHSLTISVLIADMFTNSFSGPQPYTSSLYLA